MQSESSQISIQQVKVFAFFQTHRSEWFTLSDVTVEGVAKRTVRAHAMRLVEVGLLDQSTAVFPPRYRLAPRPSERANAYLGRIEEAREILGASGAVKAA